MKKISLFFCCFFILNTILVFAQNDEVLLSIDGNKVSKEEFQRIYNKNKLNISTGEVASVDDYLELFINFKLKVFEAEKMGFDTSKSFLNEFKGYKQQLSTPYLIDNETNEKLLTEAYDRMQYEIRASHILIKLPEDAPYKDTVEAYEKAMEIRRRIVNGEAFEVVAKGSSDDPSVKDNGGDLGYFTVFQMIYPFENAVYNTEIGSVTYPVRTRFGYHIVKVVDKRKARGNVKVAHIMLAVPQGTSAEVDKQKKELITEIYHKIKKGEDFTELALEYSDDKGSARNGGELPWFGTGRMVEEFESASFALTSNGEVSQPVRTAFGWHLIKRIDREEIPSYDKAKAEIKNKISKGERAELAKKVLIEKLKKEYNFKEKVENVPVKYDSIENIFIVKKEYLDERAVLKDTLFCFLDKVIFQNEYVQSLQNSFLGKEMQAFDYKIEYENFIGNKILALEEGRLEEKYPDYKYLLKEYHDGMLLFEITDKEVWTKAAEDSVGLRKFYEENKKNYKWKERWEGSLYLCSNKEVYNSVSEIINKRNFGRKVTNEDLLKKTNGEEELLKIESGLYSKGDNQFVDYLVWGEGNDGLKEELVLHKGNIKSPEIKTFEEAKGYIISDYQNYLDKEWVKKLRDKYNIQINESVLSSIK